MKILKKTCLMLFCAATVTQLRAQRTTCDPFPLLDLERPGLEQVKKAYGEGNAEKASEALLSYYHNRGGAVLAGLDPNDIENNPDEQRWADESLEHRFHAHKGYPSYFYGDDIDWQLWPVKDNELRWQLHRHYWFIPLAKAYRTTGDEKYVKAWMEHYTDWVKKNPLVEGEKSLLTEAVVSSGEVAFPERPDHGQAMVENTLFAWRPLEVSRRLQDQVAIFELTVDSPSFTPEFLDMFLTVYHQHADRILHNYSEHGNHLLFEAQRMIYAGVYFPEFKDAPVWRKSGIEILNREIGVQVYPDGMQYELDPGYHIGSINIFLKALEMAKANGLEGEFPATYIATVEKMIEAVWTIMYPDYTDPIFSDHKLGTKSAMLDNFQAWTKTFPDNEQIEYFAAEGKTGKSPDYRSKGLTNAGFFVFRDGWGRDATVMIVKAGPPSFWHNQPDNGTFELWRKGRNFFIDSGCYVYSGGPEVQKERDWFRQTRVHNTLTLDNRTIEKTDSKTLRWETGGDHCLLVTKNESYPGLTHRRSVFFLPGGIFVIADMAAGDATGNVAVHFNLIESEPVIDKGALEVRTTFIDGNNIVVKTFCDQPAILTEEEGWVSRAYRQKNPRPAYAVRADKDSGAPVMFLTVIAPAEQAGDISAMYSHTPEGMTAEIEVGGKRHKVNYKL